MSEQSQTCKVRILMATSLAACHRLNLVCLSVMQKEVVKERCRMYLGRCCHSHELAKQEMTGRKNQALCENSVPWQHCHTETGQ